jgi:hypothetical protein
MLASRRVIWSFVSLAQIGYAMQSLSGHSPLSGDLTSP